MKKAELQAALKLQLRWRQRHQPSDLASASTAASRISSGGRHATPPSAGRREQKRAATVPGDSALGGLPLTCTQLETSYAQPPSASASVLNAQTAALAREVRTQAAHYIDSTLSRALLLKHLKVHRPTAPKLDRPSVTRGTTAP